MRNTEEQGGVHGFSLLGGPLHRLGSRLGLVREGTDTFRLGLALGVLLWAVLVALLFIDGRSDQLFALTTIGAHVRLLVVIPLFFLCEAWLDPRLRTFVSMIVRSGVVTANDVPTLEAELARTARRKDSWWAEAIPLVAVVLVTVIGPQSHWFGVTGAYDASRGTTGVPVAALWYWFICLPLFRFLLLRWIWRLGLWAYFLWRLARLELHLVPTHPDGAGGLGYLEVVHVHLIPMIVALSALQTASLTEELSGGAMTFEGIYPALALVLVVEAAVFLGPLFIFTSRLWACRVKGLSDYMEFAASYVSGFDRKWLGADGPPGEPLLGTPDLQSLADLNNSLSVLRSMRWLPVSSRTLADFAIAAVLPWLPLLLFKYPVGELAEKFFSRLVGL